MNVTRILYTLNIA